FLTGNAARPSEQERMLDDLAPVVAAEGGVSVFVHALAFGALGALVSSDKLGLVRPKQLESTFNVMAHSFVHWLRGLAARALLPRGAKVFAMASEGASRVVDATYGYGAIAAAKAALEAYTRQLAVELAPRGVAVNAVRAGITDTEASRQIIGFDRMFE